MASAKAKRLRERLEQIKEFAVLAAINEKQVAPALMISLAEEAAGLGLELADLLDAKGK